MPRFEIDVVVAAACPDGRFALEYDFAAASWSLPSAPLGDGDSRSAAYGVLARLTGFDASWLSVTQVGFVDRPGDRKAVLYFAAFPERCPLLPPSAEWLAAEDVASRPGVDPESRSLAFQSLNHRLR